MTHTRLGVRLPSQGVQSEVVLPNAREHGILEGILGHGRREPHLLAEDVLLQGDTAGQPIFNNLDPSSYQNGPNRK